MEDLPPDVESQTSRFLKRESSYPLTYGSLPLDLDLPRATYVDDMYHPEARFWTLKAPMAANHPRLGMLLPVGQELRLGIFADPANRLNLDVVFDRINLTKIQKG